MAICCKNLFDGFCWCTENNQSNKIGMMALSFQKQCQNFFTGSWQVRVASLVSNSLLTHTLDLVKKKCKPKPKKKDCFKWHFKFILHVPCEQLTLSV